MLLATHWSLVGARVTKFVYILMRHIFFSKTPFSKLLMFMRQSEKIQKLLLATHWSLVGARVSTFVYTYLCDTTFFQKPLFKVINVHATVTKIPKKSFLQHRGHLLEQKGSQNCSVYLMVQNYRGYFKPLFMMLCYPVL